MKILKESTIVAMKREILSKMMDVAQEVYEKYGESTPCGAMKDQQEELLDICLKHWSKSPTGRVVYGWTNTQMLDNLIPKSE